MLFIGHTRFSLFNPESVAWVASNRSRFKSDNEYRSYLFSDERLQPRIDIFVGKSLPLLERASRGVDFYHVVSYSEHLPEPFEEILIEASRKFPFVVLDKHVDGQASVNTHKLAHDIFFSGDGTHRVGDAFGLFRLDDDDLLSVDYFDQMSSYVTAANVGMLVTLGRGVTAVYEDGSYYGVRESFRPMIAIGLLSICKFTEDGTLVKPLDVSHHISDRFNAVIVDSRKIGYLWSRHVSQDTALSYGVRTGEDARKRVFQDIATLPSLPWETDLRDSFPILSERIFRQDDPTIEHLNLGVSTQSILEEPLLVVVPDVAGDMSVSLEMFCGPGTTPGNALMRFSLIGSNGGSLSDEEEEAVLRAGLVKSPNPDIGFYQYLNVHPGMNRLTAAVSLPLGVRCRQLAIRRWRDASVDVELRRLDLFYGGGA